MNPKTDHSETASQTQNAVKQEVMETGQKMDGNCRKNCRDSKVAILDGPGSKGQRGPWKMARCGNTEIPIYRNKNRDSWLYEVRFFTPQGEPDNKRFSDPEQAVAYAIQLAQLPAPAVQKLAHVPRERLVTLAEALEKLEPILEPLKISVSAGVEEYAAAKEKAGLRDLREVVSEYLQSEWIKRSKLPLENVITRFLDAMQTVGHSQTYLDTLHRNLRRLAVGCGKKQIREVTKEDLLDVIKGAGGPRSQKTFRTSIRTFYSWCKVQEYLNPGKPTEAEKLDKIKVKHPRPGIYTPAEAKKMLGQITDIPSVVCIAFSLFTGIRQIELGRINWKAVNADGHIIVEAADEKRGRARVIPIQKVLHEWLSPFYKCTGLIVPFTRMRERISKMITELGIKYQRNGFRHSYASYRLAQTDSVMQTSQEDGHWAYILEQNYHHRVPRDQALEFFSLTPEACGRKHWKQEAEEYLFGRSPIKERQKKISKGKWPIIPPEKPDQRPESSKVETTPFLPIFEEPPRQAAA